MEKQCTKCHSKEILIKHPVRKWPNGNPEEFYVCSNKKCSYHRFSISEEEISQAILSAEANERERIFGILKRTPYSTSTDNSISGFIERVIEKALSLPDQEELEISKEK